MEKNQERLGPNSQPFPADSEKRGRLPSPERRLKYEEALNLLNPTIRLFEKVLEYDSSRPSPLHFSVKEPSLSYGGQVRPGSITREVFFMKEEVVGPHVRVGKTIVSFGPFEEKYQRVSASADVLVTSPLGNLEPLVSYHLQLWREKYPSDSPSLRSMASMSIYIRPKGKEVEMVISGELIEEEGMISLARLYLPDLPSGIETILFTTSNRNIQLYRVGLVGDKSERCLPLTRSVLENLAEKINRDLGIFKTIKDKDWASKGSPQSPGGESGLISAPESSFSWSSQEFKNRIIEGARGGNCLDIAEAPQQIDVGQFIANSSQELLRATLADPEKRERIRWGIIDFDNELLFTEDDVVGDETSVEAIFKKLKTERDSLGAEREQRLAFAIHTHGIVDQPPSPADLKFILLTPEEGGLPANFIVTSSLRLLVLRTKETPRLTWWKTEELARKWEGDLLSSADDGVDLTRRNALFLAQKAAEYNFLVYSSNDGRNFIKMTA